MKVSIVDWKPMARPTNNALVDRVDRMVDAIHMVVDMRATDTAEDTVTLALAEKLELMSILLRSTFNGTAEEW